MNCYQIITTNLLVVTVYANSMREAIKQVTVDGYQAVTITVIKNA